MGYHIHFSKKLGVLSQHPLIASKISFSKFDKEPKNHPRNGTVPKKLDKILSYFYLVF